MKLRPCPCGATPRVEKGWLAGYVVLQVKCQCGPKGARLLCASLVEVLRAREAAVDWWNMAG